MKTIKFYNNRNIIHKNLKEARIRLNMSQKQLAIALQTYGVSIDQQAISKIEKNLRVVTDYEIVCLCKILKVDEKWLLSSCYDLLDNM